MFTEEEMKMVGEMKANLPVEELCEGLPVEFATYLNYTRSLKFGAKPKYTYLRQLFTHVFKRKGFQYDKIYDWTEKRYNELLKQASSTPMSKPTP